MLNLLKLCYVCVTHIEILLYIYSEEPIKSKVGPTVPGEITLYDLPPIEDLKIAIDENVELVELGVVMNIVDCLGNDYKIFTQI